MIAVAGGKGGCGKTSTALGIATAFGQHEQVTVADTDVDMPDLHVATETPAAPGLDALARGAPIDTCRYRAIDHPGVSVVPAGTEAESIVAALERLRGLDERVVIDTPAGASIDVTRPIRVADRVILVSTPTRESLTDAAKTAAIARSIGTEVEGVVMNRSEGTVDPRPLLDCSVLAHVPTAQQQPPHRANRVHFSDVVRAVSKRNT